jgi:hypothetical protein
MDQTEEKRRVGDVFDPLKLFISDDAPDAVPPDDSPEMPKHADFQVVGSHNVNDFVVTEVPDGEPGPPSKIALSQDMDIFRIQAKIDMHMTELVSMAKDMGALYCYDRLAELWREMNNIAVDHFRGCNGKA